MPRRLPKITPAQKDYSICPWTDFFRCKSPVKKLEELQKTENTPIDKLVNHLHFDLKLDRNKAELLTETLDFQDKLVKNDKEINLLVNIPFCMWKCFNCNRMIYEKSKNGDIYPYYYEALLKEILQAREIIFKKSYIVQNVIILGNILALEPDKIDEILKQVSYAFGQITIELGSPDFVSEEKLAILKKYNVERIIINNLTFNTVSLRHLCRRFEFKEIYEAYKLIIDYGFETSFELVVGLLDEKELQLKRNLELAVELGASNIDLYAKKCRFIDEKMPLTDKIQISDLRELLEFSHNFMIKRGYKPYFVYCSETQNGCFENVGYSIPEKQCRVMHDLVDEISTVLACGTSVDNMIVNNLENKRTYLQNPQDMSQYVFGIDEILSKKAEFFK